MAQMKPTAARTNPSHDATEEGHGHNHRHHRHSHLLHRRHHHHHKVQQAPPITTVNGFDCSSDDINDSADAFIKRFRQQLELQRLQSIENYQQMLARGL